MTETVIEEVLILDPELLSAVEELIARSGYILDACTNIYTALLFCICVVSAAAVCLLLWKAVKILI